MGNHVLLVGWNRAVAGREQDAVELFATAMNYYEGQKRAGTIDGYENIFLDPHGGDLNGFTLVRGEAGNLDALSRSDEFLAIMTKAAILLEGMGMIRGVTGDEVGKRMQIFLNSLPKR